MATDVLIRMATAADAASLAALKTESAHPEVPPTQEQQDAFATALSNWMLQQGDDLVCVLAEAGGATVGMAWMVVFERVPDPHDVNRRTADVQSVWVAEQLRNGGVGARMIDALTAEADRRGIPRVQVHSGHRAVQFYLRNGFAHSEQLLQRERHAG
jgi:GNAT superfamily N-acetyltransferase